MTREVVATQNAPGTIGPSQGLKRATWCLSRQTGIVPQTKQFAGNTVAEQTAQAQNLQTILEAAGTDMAHVVKTTVFKRIWRRLRDEQRLRHVLPKVHRRVDHCGAEPAARCAGRD